MLTWFPSYNVDGHIYLSYLEVRGERDIEETLNLRVQLALEALECLHSLQSTDLGS